MGSHGRFIKAEYKMEETEREKQSVVFLLFCLQVMWEKSYSKPRFVWMGKMYRQKPRRDDREARIDFPRECSMRMMMTDFV